MQTQADLYQPSLAEEDHIVGCHKPFDPWHLLLGVFLLSVVFGWIFGLILYPLNWKRLGRPERIPSSLALLGASILVPCGVFYYGMTQGLWELGQAEEGQVRWWLVALGAVFLLPIFAAAWISMRQRRRFLMVERSTQETTSILRWVLILWIGRLLLKRTLRAIVSGS